MEYCNNIIRKIPFGTGRDQNSEAVVISSGLLVRLYCTSSNILYSLSLINTPLLFFVFFLRKNWQNFHKMNYHNLSFNAPIQLLKFHLQNL